MPDGQPRVTGRNIRLGTGAVDVTAVRGDNLLRTTVRQTRRWDLTVGVVLPRGRMVSAVRLDGRRASYDVERTARGRVLTVDAGRGVGTSELVVRLRG